MMWVDIQAPTLLSFGGRRAVYRTEDALHEDDAGTTVTVRESSTRSTLNPHPSGKAHKVLALRVLIRGYRKYHHANCVGA